MSGLAAHAQHHRHVRWFATAPTQAEVAAMLLDALKNGVMDASPGEVPVGPPVVLTAGIAGRYACVTMLRRDWEEPGLLYDTYFLARDSDGRWLVPGGCGGSVHYEWIRRRPGRGSEYADWEAANSPWSVVSSGCWTGRSG